MITITSAFTLNLEPCATNDPGVDSSPAAEDEQGPSYVMEREKEMANEDMGAEYGGEGPSRPVVEWCQCGRGMCPVCIDQ